MSRRPRLTIRSLMIAVAALGGRGTAGHDGLSGLARPVAGPPASKHVAWRAEGTVVSSPTATSAASGRSSAVGCSAGPPARRPASPSPSPARGPARPIRFAITEDLISRARQAHQAGPLSRPGRVDAMPFPRLKVQVRTLMVAVAVAAAADRRLRAGSRRGPPPGSGERRGPYRSCVRGRASRSTRAAILTSAAPSVADGYRRRAELYREEADYHGKLRRKYDHAARYPWLPVAPDPPEPR